jgi:hypothetical protein
MMITASLDYRQLDRKRLDRTAVMGAGRSAGHLVKPVRTERRRA